jgi:hypothetical protein
MDTARITCPVRLVLPVFLLLVVASESSAQTRLLVTARDLNERYPLPDVQIRVTRMDNGQVVARATTDPRGGAVVRVPSSRAYRVEANREGYLSYPVGMIWASPGDVSVPMQFSSLVVPGVEVQQPQSVPEYGVIGGVVSTVSGAPLADFPVRARSTGGLSSEYGAVTRANGSYRISLPPGTYTISAGGPEILAPPKFRNARTYTTHMGTDSGPVFVTSHDRIRVDLQLPAGPQLFNVRAKVIDGNGRPLKRATVRVFGRREPGNSSFSGAAITGAKGSAMLGPLTPGPLLIVATAEGTPTDLAGTTSVEIANEPLDVTVVVSPGAAYSGRVEFINRATPLHGSGGLHLIFDPPGFRLSWTSSDPGLIAPDGSFMVKGLLGERCLRISDIPEGWRLKDVVHQGQDLTNRLVRFEPNDVYSDVIIRIERGRPPDTQPECQP